MSSKEYTVIDAAGLHARPAAAFVKAMATIATEVNVTVAKRSANAKSILEVLGLGIAQGTSITIDFGQADEGEIAKVESALAGVVVPKPR